MLTCRWRTLVKAGVVGATLLVVVGLVFHGGREREAQAEVAVDIAREDSASTQAERDAVAVSRPPAPDPRSGLDLGELTERNGRLVQEIEGRTLVTTLDPELHRFAESLLEEHHVPGGAAVAINSRTGEVLALAEHSERDPGERVALSSEAPAASIFKVVTAAALLELAGLSPDLEVCYHGGTRGITEALLRPNPARDTRCATLSSALGRSLNVIFARMADRHLSREQLAGFAHAFGFNAEIPFDLPLDRAGVDIPEERVERARAAAGFWHSHISPLHAAMMAQAVAQEGAMLRPYLVDEVTDASGREIFDGSPLYLGQACSPETAHQLARMMVLTTTVGTARSSFRDREGRPMIPGIDAAGKTGTLHARSPFRAYDWFMGFAPADDPEIAVAGLVINDPQWRIKGHYVGRELFRRYFQLQRQRRERSGE